VFSLAESKNLGEKGALAHGTTERGIRIPPELSSEVDQFNHRFPFGASLGSRNTDVNVEFLSVTDRVSGRIGGKILSLPVLCLS